MGHGRAFFCALFLSCVPGNKQIFPGKQIVHNFFCLFILGCGIIFISVVFLFLNCRERVLAVLFAILFGVIPIVALVFFIISLCLYISAKNQNKKLPESVSSDTLKSRKTTLIVSSVTAGVIWAIVIGLFALLASAIAYM